MNDFESDELASAYLDDAVTDEERARVDADPALRGRVEELRHVRDTLQGSPVEPSPTGARDAAIATAIAASPVVDLRSERSRRRLRIASIAAAVVLLLGAAGLLVRSASTDSSTKSASTAAAASSSSASAPVETAAGAQAAVPNRPFASYAGRDALVAAVNTETASRTSTATGNAAAGNDSARMAEQSAPPTHCAVPTPEDASTSIFSDDALLDGMPVQIDVFLRNDGSRRLVVTSTSSCTLVFTQTL